MFHLESADYIRLTYESLQQAYEAHAEAAARLSRLSSYFRLGTLAVTGATAVLSAIAISGGWGVQMATAIIAACAFGTCAAYVGFNQQPRIYGHRASAARIWVIVEKYRALIADLSSGAIDVRMLHERRNALLYEASEIFEKVAPDDRFTFEIARRALGSRSATPEPSPQPRVTPPAPPAAAFPQPGA
jgi:conflict system pore-forming effector with SLATT domain